MMMCIAFVSSFLVTTFIAWIWYRLGYKTGWEARDAYSPEPAERSEVCQPGQSIAKED